ncbi:protein FMC1 homolog [Callospermophilus lateralis]
MALQKREVRPFTLAVGRGSRQSESDRTTKHLAGVAEGEGASSWRRAPFGSTSGKDIKMAALGSPARTLRGLLRELRYLSVATGRPYRDTAAYRYLVKAFRAHRVTSEKLCRAQHELHFQAATYLCLLRSIREHVALHQEFHGRGERSVEESAGLVGLQLPHQPGGKGWEP